MKRLIISFWFLFMGFNVIIAQNSRISSVEKFNPRSVHQIKLGGEVKGYFAYYLIDKKDRANNNYLLQIYDENLNEAGQKKITIPKEQLLCDVAFDGGNIVTKFIDTRSKNQIFMAYDSSAQQIGELVETISKNEYYTILMGANGQSDANPTFVSVEGAGFVNYTIEKFKKIGYQIKFYNGSNIKKGWTYVSDKNSEEVKTISYLASSENVLLSMTTSRDKLLTMKGFRYNILAVNMKTGKKLGEAVCGNSKYNYIPMGSYIENEKYIVVGQFIKKEDDLIKTPSLGLAVVEYDFSGKLLSEKYTLWKDGLGKFAEMKGNKLLDGGYIFFHKIIKAPDGNIVLIGEQFHKAANAAGIVAAVMGNYGASASKLVIDNFLFLTLNTSYDLIGIKKIEKGASDFSVRGMDYIGPNLAAYIANASGAFDFEYTSFSEDKSKFSVVYTDYDKLEDSKKKEIYIGNVSYAAGQYAVDRVPYKRESGVSLYRIYPAKNGYFMLLTYSKKTKDLDLNLVKFNN